MPSENCALPAPITLTLMALDMLSPLWRDDDQVPRPRSAAIENAMRSGGVDHYDLVRTDRKKFAFHLDRDLTFKHIERFDARVRVRSVHAAVRLDLSNVHTQLVRHQAWHCQEFAHSFGLDVRELHRVNFRRHRNSQGFSLDCRVFTTG